MEKISSANNVWFMLAIFLIFFYWTWSHNIYYHSALNHQDTLSGYSKPTQPGVRFSLFSSRLRIRSHVKTDTHKGYFRALLFVFWLIKIIKPKFQSCNVGRCCWVLGSCHQSAIINWLTWRSIDRKFSQYLQKSTALYLSVSQTQYT